MQTLRWQEAADYYAIAEKSHHIMIKTRDKTIDWAAEN